MINILNIETSASVCSVSVCTGSTLLAQRESLVERSHASVLTVLIGEAMGEAGLSFSELSAVAVSRGPGSYTGLRIGVSAAKGICYATGIPLIAIDTLTTMVHRVINPHVAAVPGNTGERAGGQKIDPPVSALSRFSDAEKQQMLLCPMIDARRMEVYMALFDPGGRQVSSISAEIIDNETFSRVMQEKTLVFFGDGAGKCRELLEATSAIYIPGIYPSAGEMAQLAHEAFTEGRFENTAYFEPFYLKDFIATKPKERLTRK